MIPATSLECEGCTIVSSNSFLIKNLYYRHTSLILCPVNSLFAMQMLWSLKQAQFVWCCPLWESWVCLNSLRNMHILQMYCSHIFSL